jgi:hypothetical protein
MYILIREIFISSFHYFESKFCKSLANVRWKFSIHFGSQLWFLLVKYWENQNFHWLFSKPKMTFQWLLLKPIMGDYFYVPDGFCWGGSKIGHFWENLYGFIKNIKPLEKKIYKIWSSNIVRFNFDCVFLKSFLTAL